MREALPVALSRDQAASEDAVVSKIADVYMYLMSKVANRQHLVSAVFPLCPPSYLLILAVHRNATHCQLAWPPPCMPGVVTVGSAAIPQRQVLSHADSPFDVLHDFFQQGASDPPGPAMLDNTLFEPSGRIGVFLSRCFLYRHLPRVSLFLRFFGVIPDKLRQGVHPLSLDTFYRTVDVMQMVSRLEQRPFPPWSRFVCPLAG